MKKYLRNRLCVPVEGRNRSIIYDLIRNDYHHIPNELYKVIASNDVLSSETFNDELSKEWLNLLLKEEILFEIESTNEKKLFPKLDTNFYTPFSITDIIIHADINMEVLTIFQDLDIRNVSIIVEKYNTEVLINLLQEISKLEIDSISLLLIEEDINYTYDIFENLSIVDQLFNILLFKSTCTNILENKIKLFSIVDVPYSYIEYSSNVFPEKVGVNFDHFFESYNHHNYFNQKVYIDKQGTIKNGLNNNESFENINSITKEDFLKLIGSKKFQKLWNVKKEDTLICKDCEFRFMCVDPRVPKQNTKGQWYHNKECNYNPYLSKWKNEDGYRTLMESGVDISKTGELSIDKEVLKNTFEDAWS
jgi:SPASM domain peptide maturase of grasp-with-spasm system